MIQPSVLWERWLSNYRYPSFCVFIPFLCLFSSLYASIKYKVPVLLTLKINCFWAIIINRCHASGNLRQYFNRSKGYCKTIRGQVRIDTFGFRDMPNQESPTNVLLSDRHDPCFTNALSYDSPFRLLYFVYEIIMRDVDTKHTIIADQWWDSP